MLIPARGRPALLQRAVQSCFERAAQPDDVQVLVRVDEDDTGNRTIQLPDRVTRLVGSRGRGYSDVDRYLNDLLPHVLGDWILPFNDDCLIASDQWETLLLNVECPDQAPEVVALRTKNQHGQSHTVLPVIRASTARYLGVVTGNAHFDAWIDHIYGPLGRLLECDLKIWHDHHPAPRGKEPPDCFVELARHWYQGDRAEAVRTKLRELMEQ